MRVVTPIALVVEPSDLTSKYGHLNLKNMPLDFILVHREIKEEFLKSPEFKHIVKHNLKKTGQVIYTKKQVK